MRNKNLNKLIASMLFMLLCLTTGKTFAQAVPNKMEVATMNDCCMMKDGKMMQLKDGKIKRMKKSVMMANGTKCKRNGVCIMADGSRMKMKDGNCMDMSGKLDNCAATTSYTCSMHPQITSGKSGKCPVCGMDLVVKK